MQERKKSIFDVKVGGREFSACWWNSHVATLPSGQHHHHHLTSPHTRTKEYHQSPFVITITKEGILIVGIVCIFPSVSFLLLLLCREREVLGGLHDGPVLVGNISLFRISRKLFFAKKSSFCPFHDFGQVQRSDGGRWLDWLFWNMQRAFARNFGLQSLNEICTAGHWPLQYLISLTRQNIKDF